MERIFTGNTEFYLQNLQDIMEEALEANAAYLRKDLLPADKTPVSQLLHVVYAYVKGKGKDELTTAGLIDCLREIAETGEVMYMRCEETEKDAAALRKAFDDGLRHTAGMAVLAGMTLEYYFNAFEKGRHDAVYGKKVTRAMKALRTAVCVPYITDPDRKEPERKAEKPMPVRIKEYLDEHMTGQEEAKKVLAMAIYRYVTHGERNVVLLEGSTGVGKTFLFENLAQCELLRDQLTFFSYTATQLTPNGFSGDDVSDLFKAYKKACERRLSCPPFSPQFNMKGVIFIDEMDKLFTPNHDSHGDDVNQTILQQLLTAVAGTVTIEGVETKDVLFIFAGAFEDLENAREKKRKGKNVGFYRTDAVGSDDGGFEEETYDLKRELIAHGAPRQFMARINHVVHMARIDRESMRQILTGPKNGVLTVLKDQFERDGLTLCVENEGVIEKLLDQIMACNTGARGVRERLTAMISAYDYDMLEQGYSIMILHEGVLRGEKPYFEKGA